MRHPRHASPALQEVGFQVLGLAGGQKGIRESGYRKPLSSGRDKAFSRIMVCTQHMAFFTKP